MGEGDRFIKEWNRLNHSSESGSGEKERRVRRPSRRSAKFYPKSRVSQDSDDLLGSSDELHANDRKPSRRTSRTTRQSSRRTSSRDKARNRPGVSHKKNLKTKSAPDPPRRITA